MSSIERCLIANRGEIARRIARTGRELGVTMVAAHTAEERDLADALECDARVTLPGHGAAAYLDPAIWVAAAREAGCDAVHPGYGFLSESALFAEACEAAGLVFVGPPPEILARLGDKRQARDLARSLGIPTLPGEAVLPDADAARRFFDSLPDGAAMALKAAAGGGGRGIRVVRTADEIEVAFERSRSEAERAFGDGDLYAERWLTSARHVEVQLVGDGRGQVTHLWDRDCSLQRRNQKLVEFAPAPGLPARTRDALREAACALGRAIRYRSVGTIEFLVSGDDAYWFLEANPRLQVEHTVTEEITGVDLVEVQLRVAQGATLRELGLERPPEVRGTAVELRWLAEGGESPSAPRPSARTIESWTLPSGPGVRIETALRPGLAPHPAFDSLLAKIVIAWPGDDASRLAQRTRRALAEAHIEGPETNLGWLRALADRPEFEKGVFETSFFEREAGALAAAAEAAVAASSPGDGERSAPVRAARATAASSVISETPTDAPNDVPTDAPRSGIRAIVSPLPGTVLDVIEAGAGTVPAGTVWCVIESMKMEHVIEAPSPARMERRFVQPGDVVEPGQTLFWIVAESDQAAPEEAVPALDLDAVRPDLAALQTRRALLDDDARPEAVARRRSRGQRTARENLAALCDPGSFLEYGAFAVAAQRRQRGYEELQRKTPADAILTGFGTINAERFGAQAARCAVLVADATVLAGTQGWFHHHKIDRILELAERAATPVVFLPEGGGGRPNDTDTGELSTAGLDVTSFHAFARLSGRVPRISVVSGYCFAGSAAFAGCSDVLIATRNTSLAMGGPAMIEGGGLGQYAPQDVGPTSVQVPNGVIDVLVEDEAEAIETARRTLGYFQSPDKDWRAGDARRLRQLIPENRRRVYEVRRVIEGLCDTDSVLELRREFAPGMITALCRLEGRPVGLIANDPMHLGGAIDDVGAEKAARFLQLCDAFGLPVLSLCDTPGFMVGPEIEKRGQVRKVSRLFVTGATLSVPLVMVILRKGYGLGAQAMAGGSFKAPLLTVAWPTGEIGGMGLEGAVELGFSKQLAAQETPEARAALREKLVGALYDKGQAIHAASHLEFDAVIDPAETREVVLKALDAFGTVPASHRMIDTA